MLILLLLWMNTYENASCTEVDTHCDVIAITMTQFSDVCSWGLAYQLDPGRRLEIGYISQMLKFKYKTEIITIISDTSNYFTTFNGDNENNNEIIQ